MHWLDFGNRSLAVNFAVFGACTVVVCIAGWNIARLADRFGSATGLASPQSDPCCSPP